MQFYLWYISYFVFSKIPNSNNFCTKLENLIQKDIAFFVFLNTNTIFIGNLNNRLFILIIKFYFNPYIQYIKSKCL